MTFSELNEFFKKRYLKTYDRNNFDKFLKAVDFSFTVPSIHVTGTNGKGSICNFLKSIYVKNGYKVGTFVSPFFIDTKDMIYLNENHISEEEILEIFNQYYDLFVKYELTTFEMQTFIALTYFKNINVDVAVIEVGMGGFIDATNIFTPSLSIISNIGLEHTSVLGRSLSEIAYNKAGIIKKEIPCLVGKIDESALFAIKEYAKTLDAKVIMVNEYFNEKIIDNKIHFDYLPYKDIVLNTTAFYQCKNASLAIEATRILENILPIDINKMYEGLLNNNLPARFEYINDHLLVDGAHNPDAIIELVNSLKNINKPIHVVFACFRDKNIERMLISLGEISNDIALTTFNHNRARNEEDYFLYLGDYKFYQDYHDAIDNALNNYPDDLVLVCGSLYFAELVRSEYKNEK
ncbi:MAG: cyanophycin synthetase [Bacilli bacterium]|nr:cyanophycin synthetase [Bacilli bacterium]